MNKINQEEFNKALSAADTSVKDLMGSTEIYDSIKKILTDSKISIPPEELVLPVGYHLLKIRNTDETLEELQELGVLNSLHFLTNLKELLIKPATFSMKVAPNEGNLSSEIEQVEHEIESLHSIRTMGEDMDNAKLEERVHSSNQDALLHKETTATPQVTQPDDTPRWGNVE